MKAWFGRYRSPLALLVLAITVVVFVRFFVLHPGYLAIFHRVSSWTVLGIVGFNILALFTLVGINHFLLQLCGVRIGWLEQLQLTSYSAIANFFGPLQSGPGVRALYLKTKYKVGLRRYAVVTLVYYAIFAGVSALFLFVFSRPWPVAILAVGLVALVSWAVIQFIRRGQAKAPSGFSWQPAALAGLIVLTCLQVTFIAGWYWVELRTVAPSTTVFQALTYTGAANFAMFVALTPDAIGFREAFLFFSQRLHHVNSAAIVSANIIDRAVYAAFLGGLFLIVVATHVREKFKVVSAPEPASSLER